MSFSKPKIQVAPAQPAPTVDNSADVLAKAETEERLRRNTTGRASTILTSPQGLLSTTSSAAAQLLGQ